MFLKVLLLYSIYSVYAYYNSPTNSVLQRFLVVILVTATMRFYHYQTYCA